MGNPFVKCLGILTGFILGLILIILLSGCSKKVYIPMESSTIRADTIERVITLTRRDTVTRLERVVEYRRDSIAPILDSIGRMIGFDRWHVIDRSSDLSETVRQQQSLIDSLRTVSRDSVTIREPYPIEKVIEVNKLKRWQKVLIAVSITTIIVIFIGIFRILRNRFITQ